MTKLQLLNSYLTERLMVAIGEILEVVEGTVLKYEEETTRTRQENQVLKRRLHEIGLGVEWTGETDARNLNMLHLVLTFVQFRPV